MSLEGSMACSNDRPPLFEWGLKKHSASELEIFSLSIQLHFSSSYIRADLIAISLHQCYVIQCSAHLRPENLLPFLCQMGQSIMHSSCLCYILLVYHNHMLQLQ